MGNYLKIANKQRMQALLELNWSYRRIERETGVRRDTVGRYDPRRNSNADKVPTGPVGKAARVPTGSVSANSDMGQFSTQIDKAQEILGKPCQTAVADAGCAHISDLHKVSQQGVQVLVPTQILASGKEFGEFDKRKFKATTHSRHQLPVAENLLGQQFQLSQSNRVWLSDITYVPTDEGWLYLTGHKDLFTSEIVGYAMGERLTRNLVSQSVLRAMTAKRPAGGLIHHSDRGSQYCAYEYQQMLGQFDLRPSMSGRGNCFDNAPMESFWGTLKQELVHHRHYTCRQEAMREITEYIEIFYNRQRRQERLGFLSPAAYEQKFYAGQLAA